MSTYYEEIIHFVLQNQSTALVGALLTTIICLIFAIKYRRGRSPKNPEVKDIILSLISIIPIAFSMIIPRVYLEVPQIENLSSNEAKQTLNYCGVSYDPEVFLNSNDSLVAYTDPSAGSIIRKTDLLRIYLTKDNTSDPELSIEATPAIGPTVEHWYPNSSDKSEYVPKGSSAINLIIDDDFSVVTSEILSYNWAEILCSDLYLVQLLQKETDTTAILCESYLSELPEATFDLSKYQNGCVYYIEISSYDPEYADNEWTVKIRKTFTIDLVR